MRARRLIPVARRLGWSAFTIAGVVAITFAVAYIIPADPAALLAGEGASPAQIAAIRKTYGLDQPLGMQLLRYYQALVQGDLGRSLFTARPVSEDLFARLPATFELTLAALGLTVAIGVPVGVLAAVRRNAWIDHVVRVVTVSGLAIAGFWLAIMLQLLFAMDLGWTPLGGRIAGSPPTHLTGFFLVDAAVAGEWRKLGSAATHLVLPALTLAFPTMATIVRFTRSGVLDALSKPFVQYEEAMGLPQSVIVWKYVLRNALVSTVTQLGLVTGVLLGGSVVVETIFDWPGLGFYVVNSIILSDYKPVLGFTVWISVVYILVNMAVDGVLALVDPRQAAR